MIHLCKFNHLENMIHVAVILLPLCNSLTQVIGVAVVLVLGYQYVKNKGKFSGSSGGKGDLLLG